MTDSRIPAGHLTQENVQDVYPLSPVQEGMLFHSLLTPEAPPYQEQVAYTLEGQVDSGDLERAWHHLIDRHPILRTVFYTGRKQPVQIVLKKRPIPLAVCDLRALGGEAQTAALRHLLEQEFGRILPLDRGPLIRLLLAPLAAERSWLIFTFNHIILDGWSSHVLVTDLLRLHAALVAGSPLPPADFPPYRSYIAWLGRQDREAARRFWSRQLAGFSSPTPLPTDRSAPEGSRRLARQRSACSREATLALAAMAQRLRVTLGIVARAAWALLLARASGEPEVVFGFTVSGRPADLAGAERIVGPFINTLPVRARAEEETTLSELLHALQQQYVDASRFGYLPLAEVQAASEVTPPRKLFESLMDFLSQPAVEGLASPWLRLVPGEGPEGQAGTSYDLAIDVWLGDRLEAELFYARERFDDASAERLLGCFLHLLADMAAHPGGRISELEVLPEEERRQVLALGRGAATARWEGFAPEAFAEQAAACPDRVAVVCGERHVSYGELRGRAGALARWLASQGVGGEERVAVLGQRGPELLAALLAVHQAGGVYLPLEPGHPEARLAEIVRDGGAQWVLASEGLAQCARGVCSSLPRPAQVLVWDAAPSGVEQKQLPCLGAGCGLANVFYTSGSTGSPKGAMVEHSGMLAHLWAKVELLGLDAGSAVAQNASPGFDISLWQMLAPLLVGGRVVVYGDEEATEMAELLGRVERDAVTVLETVPSLLEAMLSELPARGGPRLAGLEFLISNAETLPVPLARGWLERFPHVALVNTYGATECSDDVTHRVFRTASEVGEARVGVGRPIAGMRVWVLDGQLRPVPVGWPGQIAFSGVGVGRGYLGDAEKTARTFVPDPLAEEPGGRLYLTGDRGRWGSGGDLEFLGRLDRQVKVRGQRIEPGEVEAALSRVEGMRQAVVEARPDRQGRLRLIAWVVAERPWEEGPLRERLRQWLPQTLLPEQIVPLAALPLTRNGKVDRAALPEPEPRERAENWEAPRDEVEEKIVAIWREVLEVDRVGIRDNFFALGGHSLKTVQVRSRLKHHLDIELPLRALFDYPTVAELAQAVRPLLNGCGAEGREPIPRLPDADLYPLSHAQTWQWFAHQMGGWRAWQAPWILRLEGILDVSAFRGSLQALIERHEALRTAFFEVNGGLAQAIRAGVTLGFPLIDLAALEPVRREEELAAVLREQAVAPFDLARPPLLRAVLLRLAPTLHAVLLGLPHMVSDEWTESLLLKDLSRLYNAFRSGRPCPLSPLPIRYVDFAGWLEQRLATPELERQKSFWMERFRGVPALELPPGQSGAGPVTGSLDAGCAARLRQISSDRRTTLAATLLAGFQALLARWTSREDLTVGTVSSGRIHPDLEGIAGIFLNPLPLRADLSGDPRFDEIVDRTGESLLLAFENQDYPFHAWLEALRQRSGHSGLMPCSAWFTLASPPPSLSFEGLAVELRSSASALGVDPATGGELLLHAVESGGGIDLALLGGRQPWAVLFLAQLRRLLEQVAHNASLRLSEIDLLGEQERERLAGLRRGRPPEPALLRVLAACKPEGVAFLASDGEIVASDSAGLLDPWELARSLARSEARVLAASLRTLANLGRVLGRAVDPHDLSLDHVVAVGGPVQPGGAARLGSAQLAAFLPLGNTGAGLWARRWSEEGELFRGWPLPDPKVDVLDRWERPVAAGLSGEIHADGAPTGLRGRWGEDGAIEVEHLPTVAADAEIRPRPPLGHPYTAPQTALERRLASAWERALGIGEVGLYDDFFMLGGTPALAAEVSVRMAEADVACPAQAVIEHGSVATLAAALREHAALRGDPDGGAPLTPLQRSLLAGAMEEPAWAADAVALRSLRPLDPEALPRALATLTERHPALRAGFLRWGHLWTQELGPAGTVPLTTVDLRGLSPEEGSRRLADAVTEERRRLDPVAGPALRALLTHPEPDDLLILIVSRVAVDEPSWRVLAAELGSTLQELAGEPVPPRAPAPSFQAWLTTAERLAVCREPELRFDRGPGGRGDGATGIRTVSRHWHGRWAEAVMDLSLEDAEALLAAALGRALLDWTGRDRAIVGVERDYRRAVPDLPDLMGLVGQPGVLRPWVVASERGEPAEQHLRARRQLWSPEAAEPSEPEVRLRVVHGELPPAGLFRFADSGWQLSGSRGALRAVALVGTEGLRVLLACPMELAPAAEELLRDLGEALAALTGGGETPLVPARELLDLEELEGFFQEV
jgi:amino acid adenylation domain-containing protein